MKYDITWSYNNEYQLVKEKDDVPTLLVELLYKWYRIYSNKLGFANSRYFNIVKNGKCLYSNIRFIYNNGKYEVSSISYDKMDEDSFDTLVQFIIKDLESSGAENISYTSYYDLIYADY